MTGGRKDRGERDDAPRTSDTESGAPRGGASPGDDAKTLFAMLRSAAKEEEAEISSVPANFVSPLSGEDRAAIATAALAALARGTEARTPSLPSSAVKPPRRRLRRWFWPSVLIPLAALGGLVFALRPPIGPSLASLPPYTLDVHGGLRDMRGAVREATAAAAPLQRVAPDTELVIVARPAVAVDGEIASRAFLIRGERVEERVEEIDAPERTSPSGSLEIRIRPAGRTPDARGRAVLRVAVGRPAAIRAISLAEIGRDADEDAWLASSAATFGAPSDTKTTGASNVRWLTVPLELLGS